MAVTQRTGPKRIQRGLITFASGDLQASATLTAIDMARSEVRHAGNESGTARLWLQNATTLWGVRTTTGAVQNLAYEVVEW